MIKYILFITLIAALVPTAMSGVSASAASEIALFSTVSPDSNGLTISGNGDSAKMELKATNDNGKSKRVSGLQLTTDNVLSIEVGDKVTVKDNVDFTKAITTDARNNQKSIGITSNGVIDFAGYDQGVYTLDVVVDDDRAYEAIIAIGDQPNQIVDKEITRVNSDYRIEFVFPPIEEPINEDCDDSEGSGGLNYPFDKKSECVIEEYQQCQIDELNGLPETDRCNDLDEGFNDDCFGFTNSEECNAYWTDHDQFCEQNPEHAKCPIIYVSEGPCDGYVDTNTQECIL